MNPYDVRETVNVIDKSIEGYQETCNAANVIAAKPQHYSEKQSDSEKRSEVCSYWYRIHCGSFSMLMVIANVRFCEDSMLRIFG